MADKIELGFFRIRMILKLTISTHPFIITEYPDAISEVMDLKQTGTVQSYYEEFEGFCNLLQLSEEDAVHIFINNLNPDISKPVRNSYPKTMADALKLAKQLEFLFDDELPTNSSSPDPNIVPPFKQTIISTPPKQSPSPKILTKPTNSFMETIANPFSPLNPFKKIHISEMLAEEEGKNFNHDEVLSEMVIGHTKYLTAGSVLLKNILHCVAGYRVGFVDVCKKFEREDSNVFLFENKLIMVYDPYGFRLLVMGKKNQCILEQVLVGKNWPSLFLSHIIKQKVEDAAIHNKAVGGIGNLVHSSPNIKKEILVAGALQLVLGLFISCCSDSQRETTLLLGQLAAIDCDCKVHIVQRGVVRHLIEMLHSSDVQIKEMSAFTLGRLTQDTHKHIGIAHYDGEGGVQWLQDGEFIVQAQHVRGSFAVVCVGVSMALKMVKCHLDGDKQKQLSRGRDIGNISVTILDEVVIAFSTLSFSGSEVLTKLSFSIYVFIRDEVAQAVEPLTLVPLFNGCKQTIFIEDSAPLPSTVTSSLVEKFGYGIVFDLLRNTKETMDITERILILTEPHVWGALLVACRIYHHVEMGELAAKNLLFLDPNHARVGVAGLVLPVPEEKVIAIKMDDTIALVFGVFTWWYNNEDSELMVLFMSDISKGHKAGQFTSFFFLGSNDIFTGFTIEFVEIAWDMDADTIKTLVGKQIGKCIVKLDSIVKMFEPKPEHRKRMALNCNEAPLDIDIKNAGKVLVLDTKKLPLVGEVGIDADLVTMKKNAMGSPGFSCDSALQVTYIVKAQDKMAKFSFQVQPTELKHGSVMVVTIMSYPNTLIPSVMLGASVVAKNAYEQSLHIKFWIQTSLAPSSRVVTRYLLQSGLKTGNSKIMFMFILEDKDVFKWAALLQVQMQQCFQFNL